MAWTLAEFMQKMEYEGGLEALLIYYGFDAKSLMGTELEWLVPYISNYQEAHLELDNALMEHDAYNLVEED